MSGQHFSHYLSTDPASQRVDEGQAKDHAPRASASRRKKVQTNALAPGQNIFHDYRWSPQEIKRDGPGPKTPGRRPYEWTPRQSRELIKLIIHTDLKFDHIADAMKDENGNGPCEYTCRNHWHAIFGYRPDLARLKSKEGRERRQNQHFKAFQAHRERTAEAQQTPTGTSAPDCDLNRVLSNETGTSDLPSSSASVRSAADSNVLLGEYGRAKLADGTQNHIYPGDDDLHDPWAPLPTHTNLSYGNPAHPLEPLIEEPAAEQSDLPADTPLQRADSGGSAIKDLSIDSSDVGAKDNQQVEKKENLPSGFISWFKRVSIASTLNPSIRGSSLASSRPSYASSRPSTTFGGSNGKIFGQVQQSTVPKNAIATHLDNCSATMDVPVEHIRELIQRGADVNARNKRGETALHLAVQLGNIPVFGLLISEGADPQAKTRKGESIWEFGGRASKNVLDPDRKYSNKGQQMLDTQVAAHIEFLRATAKFNPTLTTEEGVKNKKRRTSDDSVDSNLTAQAYKRSGATKAAGWKKVRVQNEPSMFNLARSTSITMPVMAGLDSSGHSVPAQITPDAFSNPFGHSQQQAAPHAGIANLDGLLDDRVSPEAHMMYTSGMYNPEMYALPATMAPGNALDNHIFSNATSDATPPAHASSTASIEPSSYSSNGLESFLPHAAALGSVDHSTRSHSDTMSPGTESYSLPTHGSIGSTSQVDAYFPHQSSDSPSFRSNSTSVPYDLHASASSDPGFDVTLPAFPLHTQQQQQHQQQYQQQQFNHQLPPGPVFFNPSHFDPEAWKAMEHDQVHLRSQQDDQLAGLRFELAQEKEENQRLRAQIMAAASGFSDSAAFPSAGVGTYEEQFAPPPPPPPPQQQQHPMSSQSW